MSLRRKLNWCNLQGFVNSSVLCVITFVQATMTQWHCNCWVGDGMENEPIWGDFTLCIVYWYHVQFLNTLYLQYLCIFYEVIKINNVAHNFWLHHFVIGCWVWIESCVMFNGQARRTTKAWLRMRWAESLLLIQRTAAADVGEITALVVH